MVKPQLAGKVRCIPTFCLNIVGPRPGARKPVGDRAAAALHNWKNFCAALNRALMRRAYALAEVGVGVQAMSINYRDTARRDSKRSGPGWMLVVVAVIAGALITFPEAGRSLEAAVATLIPLSGI